MTRQSDVLTASRLTVEQSYAIPNSRWTLGLVTFAQGVFYGPSRATGATRLKYLAEPSVSYQITPTLAANLTYDLLVVNPYNSTLTTMTSPHTLLFPSISWDATKWLSLEPTLYITSGERVSMDTTVFNLTATMTIL
jgi:hypothetical protein